MSLGCGTYRVLIHPRDDLARAVVEVPWTTLDWSRVLDDTSEANVTAGSGCCAALIAADVRPWSHTLALYRAVGGFAYRRCWSGPIQRVRDRGALTIEARDLSAWLDRRRLRESHIFVAAALSDIYEAFWDDAMAPDPIEDYALSITPASATGDREVLSEQNRIAGDELRELGRTGLDWTVVDRTHHLGPEEIDTPPIATLIDEHFAEPPEIVLDGSEQANDWIVSGAGGGAEGDEIPGTASATPGPEGLLDAVATEASILDLGSADDAAATRLARHREASRYLREGGLVPSAPVTIDDLVPGARVKVALDGRCLPLRTTQRLTAIRVQAGGAADAPSETISVELEPLGSVST